MILLFRDIHRKFPRHVHLCALLVLGGCVTIRPVPATPRSVELHFVSSPYADYLFYLFYRDTALVPDMKSVPLDSIPQLEQLISLPEMVVSSDVRKYQDIFPLMELYRTATGRVTTSPPLRILFHGASLPKYEELRSIVVRGEDAFPVFLKVWDESVRPEEERNIQAWREQAARCDPMARLQALTRLRFPGTSLDVASIMFHPAGSANYTPLSIYSTTFEHPNLPWTLGHEATHLLVDAHVGANWRQYPAAAKVIARARAAGLDADDIEESLSLLMQVKLSQACGTKPQDYRLSDKFDSKDPKRALVASLEDGWDAYQIDPLRWPNVIDYLLDRTLVALKH